MVNLFEEGDLQGVAALLLLCVGSPALGLLCGYLAKDAGLLLLIVSTSLGMFAPPMLLLAIHFYRESCSATKEQVAQQKSKTICVKCGQGIR